MCGHLFSTYIQHLVYILSREGEIVVLRANKICLILIFILANGYAQDDPFGNMQFGDLDETPPDLIDPTPPCPLVFPEALPKAANLIVDAIGNESDHMWFMSPEYWPVPLNNSTVMNLTA